MGQHNIDPNQLFHPSRAIRDNKGFFAGRGTFLLKGLADLTIPGRSLVIYGDRGVGKTSLAWQLYDLLSGNFELIKRNVIAVADPIPEAICLWVQCTSALASVEGLMLRILHGSPEGTTIADKFPDFFVNRRSKRLPSAKLNIDLRFLSAEFDEATSLGEPSDSRPGAKREQLAIHDVFNEVIGRIHKENKSRQIIIFVDEFDVLPDRAGIGALIKTFDYVSFVLVGVAEDVRSLVEDDASVRRKIAPLRLPPLSLSETSWIFQRAENASGGRITFEREIPPTVFEQTMGFPWMIQHLGHSAVRNAIRRTGSGPLKIVVTSEDLDNAMRELIDPVAQDARQAATSQILIGDETIKIAILNALAHSTDESMGLSNIIQTLQPRAARPFAEINLKELSRLGVIRSDTSGQWSFADPVCRILVKIAGTGQPPGDPEKQP